MNYSVLWEKHKKFLTQVAGGFAVFMILLSFASGYQSTAKVDREKIITNNDKQQQLANALDTRYDREVKLKKLLVERRSQLLKSISIVDNNRITPPETHTDTKFKREKESVYARFTDRANVAGVDRPELGEIRFNVSSDLSDQDWDDRYAQLYIVDRFFHFAVDERIRSIEEVAPESIAMETIPGNKEVALYRYPVVATVVADHAAILRIMTRFQEEGGFVGVEIESMEPVEHKGKSGFVQANLRLVGIHLDKPREDMGRSRRPSGGFGRPRR